MSNENDFLPKDYEPPKGESRYMKFQSGTNKFRILSRPIIGWEDWEEKKPIRFKMDEKPDKSIDPSRPIKHFWAMVVWDFGTECIKILEITQITIQQAITALTRDPEWGSPFGYNIKVDRQGEDMNTKYTIIASPPSELTDEIKEALINVPINHEAFYKGEDPFGTDNSALPDAPPEIESDDRPF